MQFIFVLVRKYNEGNYILCHLRLEQVGTHIILYITLMRYLVSRSYELTAPLRQLSFVLHVTVTLHIIVNIRYQQPHLRVACKLNVS